MGLEGWWGVECAAERCDVDGGVALRWYGSVVQVGSVGGGKGGVIVEGDVVWRND